MVDTLRLATDTQLCIANNMPLYATYGSILFSDEDRQHVQSLFIYEKLKRNMNKTLVIMFGLALIFFLGTLIITDPTLNIVLMIIAIMASNAAATMLWSVYCPSLRDTGFTSGATGFLDFVNYAAAGIVTLIIGAVVGYVGWTGIIIGLISLMAFGLARSLYVKKEKKVQE
jgi:hypothetical protein